MRTQGQKDAAIAIAKIWETGFVADASKRCDAIIGTCRMGYESAESESQEYGDSADREANEWRSLELAAIREFNDHCPVFNQ